ncbi:MAG TPA: aminotransferase class I/II-fold pyridoxal phosphate-dependent enzyme, partial [Rugosimonospora sp.]|nr:aminotransferase class I/II-fold pyridoxal phosphate-dependent enzyme [Rugosimonospora sp.]
MHEEARSDMALADVLGSWSSQSGPLYRQLASAIRAAAARGELAPGDVLPAERSLAADLAVGRSTVVHAYDLLRSEGVLESRQGSGTWIAGAERRGPAAGSGSDALRRAALQASSGIIDLATASFSAAPTVREAIASMATLVPPELLEGSGYEPMGLLALRDAVARHYAQDGLPTTPEQVLVTTGTQQALAIIVDQVVLPGDSVLVEDPTSPGVLDLLRARPVALRTTRSLASVGAEPLLDMTARSSPSLTYLMLAYGPEG